MYSAKSSRLRTLPSSFSAMPQQKAVAIRADAQRQGKTILDNAKADAAKLSEETVSRAQQDAQVWLENSQVPRVKTSARRWPKGPGRS